MAQAETETLTKILMGAALSRAVCTVAELGIPDHIESGSPQTAEYLARVSGAHERSLYRILRFLASHGLFRENDKHQFDHTPLSQCLRSDSDSSFRAAAQMFHRILPAIDGLHHSAVTGEPGFNKIFGQPLFDYVGTHPELATIFDAGMTAIHGHETAAMMEAYDFSTIRVLADIGGGNGSLLGSVLQRYPELNGILFDLGHVVGRARECLETYDVGDRCSVIEGSFFESVPSGADAYLFRHIIHDWTVSPCARCAETAAAFTWIVRACLWHTVDLFTSMRRIAPKGDSMFCPFPIGPCEGGVSASPSCAPPPSPSVKYKNPSGPKATSPAL